MRKFVVIIIFCSCVGFLLIPSMVWAKQTTISTYYPSPTGNYRKVMLLNGTNGPDENACFCAQNSIHANGKNGANCDPGETATYYNAGTIFEDPTNNGYLEICKSDGTAASYPGTCFNRFAISTGGGLGACPNNYKAGPQSTVTFVATSTNQIVTWSCCFTGSPTSVNTTKSGCFSIYDGLNSSGHPAACSSVDPSGNAYDIGCDTITDASGQNTYKRNCCYNTPTGSLTTPSTCATGGGSGTCSSGEVWYNGSCCTPDCNGAGGDGCGGSCITCGSGAQTKYYSNNAAAGQQCCCETCVGPDQYWINQPGSPCLVGSNCGANC